MYALLKRLFLIPLLAALSSTAFQYASAYESAHRLIKLCPKKSDSGNTKPEIPPFIQLSAVIDKDLLTITSSENVIARVTITDETEEECYLDCTVPLSPAYSCPLPDVNGDLILHVFIGEKEYIGYLEPEW